MSPEHEIPDEAYEGLLELRLHLGQVGDRSPGAKKQWYIQLKEAHGRNAAEIALWLFELETSGVRNPKDMENSKLQPDLLIVTVNEHETRAIFDAFKSATHEDAQGVPLDDRLYSNLGTLNNTRVYHALSEMGSGSLGAMQQTVDKAIRALDPGAVVAVGIAFGVNEQRQKIGDVLISRQLRPYDLQRQGEEILLRDDKPHASSRLINHFTVFAQTKWVGVAIIPGVILTGDKLIDDIDYRNELLKYDREAIGGEMEGTGLYVSSHDHKVDWIVIKAICDWADGKKSKNKTQRQQKAAQNAAEFLVKALEYAPLKRVT